MRIDRVLFAAELARADVNLKIISERSGLSRSTVTAVRSGKSCSEVTARRIARALGVDVEELIVKEA